MGLFSFLKKADTPTDTIVRVQAPVAGTLCAQQDLPDPVFAEGMMGIACGVWPQTGEVVAPLGGKVIAAMPHAIGLVDTLGTELILHIGVDTVEMSGDGFVVHVEVGQTVAAGQPLVSFDKQKVADAGYADVVIVAVSNTEDLQRQGKQLSCVASGELMQGDTLIEVR